MKNLESTIIDKITDLLLMLNEEKKILTAAEIAEQEDNKNDYKALLVKINRRLEKIKSIAKENDELLNNFLRLHMEVMDVVWHFEEVHDILKKLISKYDFIDKDKYKSVSFKEDL